MGLFYLIYAYDEGKKVFQDDEAHCHSERGYGLLCPYNGTDIYQ